MKQLNLRSIKPKMLKFYFVFVFSFVFVLPLVDDVLLVSIFDSSFRRSDTILGMYEWSQSKAFSFTGNTEEWLCLGKPG